MIYSLTFKLCNNRCGKHYPIPGYRLQGQCNPESFQPCCNQKIGVCGEGPDYCDCQSCTDLREMIPAEIATWVPNTCVLREMNPDEICTLFGALGISLTFLGSYNYISFIDIFSLFYCYINNIVSLLALFNPLNL